MFNVTVSSTFTLTTAGTGYIVGDALVFTGGEGSGAVATISEVHQYCQEVSQEYLSLTQVQVIVPLYISNNYFSYFNSRNWSSYYMCFSRCAVTGITIIDGGKNYATAPT